MTRYLFQENADLLEEIKKLKSDKKDLEYKYDLLAKQYASLLNRYNEVLSLAKANADANEYCIQDLEKENERLKQILEENGYFDFSKPSSIIR